MSDQTPIVPPPGAAPVYAVAAPARKRRLWPFFLGGGLLLLILLIIGGVVAFTAISAAQAEARTKADLENVEQTVVAFDKAYEDADCDDYEAVTDEDFRDDYAQDLYDDDYDCDTWSEGADNLTVDGDYSYSTDVNDVEVDGDDAEVTTTEHADGEDEVDYVYELERTDDNTWVIVSYESD